MDDFLLDKTSNFNTSDDHTPKSKHFKESIEEDDSDKSDIKVKQEIFKKETLPRARCSSSNYEIVVNGSINEINKN